MVLFLTLRLLHRATTTPHTTQDTLDLMVSQKSNTLNNYCVSTKCMFFVFNAAFAIPVFTQTIFLVLLKKKYKLYFPIRWTFQTGWFNCELFESKYSLKTKNKKENLNKIDLKNGVNLCADNSKFWRPSTTTNSWIQVDLGVPSPALTGVIVQGSTSHYVKTFSVQYSQTGSSGSWKDFDDEGGNTLVVSKPGFETRSKKDTPIKSVFHNGVN